MLFWLIWLASGIIWIGMFSASVLPAAYRRALAAVRGEGSLPKRAVRILLFAFSAAADVAVAVWAVAGFAYMFSEGFPIGSVRNIAPVLILPAAVFFAAAPVFAAGLFIIVKKIIKKPAVDAKIARIPEVSAEELGDRRHRRAASVAAVAYTAIAILAATPVLTVMLCYLAVAAFGFSRAKMVILLLAAGEAVIAAVICFFTRKRIKRYLNIIFGSLSALLFVAFAACFVVLVSAEHALAEQILMWAGVALAILIPLSVGAGIFCGVSLKRRLSKADPDVRLN